MLSHLKSNEMLLKASIYCTYNFISSLSHLSFIFQRPHSRWVRTDRRVRCFLKVPQGRGPGPAGPSQQPRQQRGLEGPGDILISTRYRWYDQYSQQCLIGERLQHRWVRVRRMGSWGRPRGQYRGGAPGGRRTHWRGPGGMRGWLRRA